MVKNLDPYRPGKEPRIIVPERVVGVTLTLRNNTGSTIDGLMLRLEEPRPKRLKTKGENKKEEKPRPFSGHDSEDEKDDFGLLDDEEEGETPRPAKELATEVQFQAKVYVKGNNAVAENALVDGSSEASLELRRPEVAIQFAPVEHGQALDLDLTLLSPAALDRESEFTVISTRNRNVLVEPETASPLRPRLVSHLVILVFTALTVAVILGAANLADSVMAQILLAYAVVVGIYFASKVAENHLRIRVETRKTTARSTLTPT